MTAPAFESHLRGSPISEPSADDRLVEFVGVQKTFDGVSYVVSDLDLTIRRGEFISLLGPSGSGKTTTLMMLAGFEDPSAGEILLNGERLSGTPPYMRGMGVVFQNYALFPHMTVTRNIAYPLVQRRVARSEIASRVADVMRLVGLSEFGERRPHQLSGGQQQRVALARALVFEPRLVLMDEPLGALDKQLREQMQYELKRLHRKLGVTMVFVTHDQGEALTMSDRIAVFNEGRIQQVDTPKAIYEHPQTAFVASFIGENNRLDGVVESIESDGCIVRTTCGLRFVGSPGAGRPVRGPCVVSIRPESVLIGPPVADLPNRQDGTVRQIIYGGDHLRIEVALTNGAAFIAKVPASGLDEQIVEGAGIAVGWPPERCQILSAN